jgi:GNAT superfamily N-acetyltransferase
MGTGSRIRDATARDRPFLIEMLVEAANWTGDRRIDREAVLGRPDLSRYISNWPASQEIGAIAATAKLAVGACWLRFFASEGPGCGYVSDEVPELSLAVAPAWRGQGVGRLLLGRIADRAVATGLTRISLSVEIANPAHHLYESEGYVIVERGPDADTMMVTL